MTTITKNTVPADALTAGRIVWLVGHRYLCLDVRHDPIGNGSAAAPRPRTMADLAWTGEGRDPGQGYRRMTAGRAGGYSWTVEAPDLDAAK